MMYIHSVCGDCEHFTDCYNKEVASLMTFRAANLTAYTNRRTNGKKVKQMTVYDKIAVCSALALSIIALFVSMFVYYERGDKK